MVDYFSSIINVSWKIRYIWSIWKYISIWHDFLKFINKSQQIKQIVLLELLSSILQLVTALTLQKDFENKENLHKIEPKLWNMQMYGFFIQESIILVNFHLLFSFLNSFLFKNSLIFFYWTLEFSIKYEFALERSLTTNKQNVKKMTGDR